MKKIEHSVQIRVRYKETDKMGMAYYSNYLVWFEIARTELLRANGVAYKEIEDKKGLYLPVVESYCRYKAPLRYDDVATVETVFSRDGAMRLVFEYVVKRDGRVVTTGYTRHVFVDGQGKPVPPPEDIGKLLS